MKVKNYIFWFILGAVIFTSLGVIAANMVNARDIVYKDTNVESAIDDLYDKAGQEIKSGLAFLISAKGEGMIMYHNYSPYGAYFDMYNLDFTGIKSFVISYSLTTTNTSYQRLEFSNSNGLNYNFNSSVSNQEIIVNEATDVHFSWMVANNNTGTFKVLSYTTMDDVVHNL